MGRKIEIDPITRLEGHGKIEIFLNDAGSVDKAYLSLPELRGFEIFQCTARREQYFSAPATTRFFLFDAIIRRPVPERMQLYGQQIGLVLLAGLMTLAFYNDIARLMG